MKKWVLIVLSFITITFSCSCKPPAAEKEQEDIQLQTGMTMDEVISLAPEGFEFAGYIFITKDNGSFVACKFGPPTYLLTEITEFSPVETPN